MSDSVGAAWLPARVVVLWHRVRGHVVNYRNYGKGGAEIWCQDCVWGRMYV
jgi:hypothetical protein